MKRDEKERGGCDCRCHDLPAARPMPPGVVVAILTATVAVAWAVYRFLLLT